MIYKICSIVIIVLLVILSLYILLNVVINQLLGRRKKAIDFLRNFKKGGYACIYLVSIPLFFMGYKYSGETILNSFFFSLKEIVNLIVLKYDTKSIELLMQASSIYNFAVYFNFVLVFVNAILLVVSLTSQYLWCAMQSLTFKLSLRRRVVIFGNNEQNINIYLSDKKAKKVLVGILKDKEDVDLYAQKIAYRSVKDYCEVIKGFLNLTKTSKKEFIWIINTGSDETNIEIAKKLINELDTYNNKELWQRFKAYVFGNPKYMDIYEDIMADSNGCISYYNKYQKIAMDFIDKYPFAKFMDEKQIDYSTSLIKPEVNINVMLIGFGNTNQQLFLTSVANNQFLTEGKGDEPKLKKVNYYIVDKQEKIDNKNLNHSYFRFKHEFSCDNPSDYLELPSVPANVERLSVDINERGFYLKLKEICSGGKADKNFVIIAFSKDLENIDMAQKLVEKRDEWGLDFEVFAKANNYTLEYEQDLKGSTSFFKRSRKEKSKKERKEGYYLFGYDKTVVYNLDNILLSEINEMAYYRNFIYDLEYEVSSNNGTDLSQEQMDIVIANANESWHKKKGLLERDSSLFACLSIRSKLNLIGLDYVKSGYEGESVVLSESEYLEIYDPKKEIKKTGKSVLGKPILHYDLKSPTSVRGMLARHEHERWNSFMISRGFIPSTKEQILTDFNGERFTNGKNYDLRRHGNLTTFNGLVEFRKMVAQRDGKSEESKDVIKYDYQLLDDAYWLLNSCGYKIIRKK